MDYEKIWGYANATPGTRHGSPEVATVTQPEAHYILITASALINFLVTLCAEQGVSIEPRK